MILEGQQPGHRLVEWGRCVFILARFISAQRGDKGYRTGDQKTNSPRAVYVQMTTTGRRNGGGDPTGQLQGKKTAAAAVATERDRATSTGPVARATGPRDRCGHTPIVPPTHARLTSAPPARQAKEPCKEDGTA